MKKGVIVSIALIASMILAACASTKTTPSPVPTTGATPTSTASPTPTDKPATPTPTEVPATPTPTSTSTPTEVPATPTPTAVPVPTANLEPTPITSGTAREIFLSNFAKMSQKGLYATQKIGLPSEPDRVWDYMFKSGDALFVCTNNYSKDFRLAKYSLSDLAQVSLLSFDDKSKYYYLTDYDYDDDELLEILESKDTEDADIVYSYYDHNFNKLKVKEYKHVTLPEFPSVSLMDYDLENNLFIYQDDKVVYKYDLGTGKLIEVFNISAITVPDNLYLAYWSVNAVEANEFKIYVEFNQGNGIIPAAWHEYKYNIDTKELTLLPDDPSVGYYAEGYEATSISEPGGERKAYYYCSQGPATINICDKDFNKIRSIVLSSNGVSLQNSSFFSVDWKNNVVLFDDAVPNENHDLVLCCYSIETGELISKLETKGSVFDRVDGLLFISGTLEENGQTRDVTYVWDYLNGATGDGSH